MYKQIKITKKYQIAFERFNTFCKEKVGGVYKTGIRNWDSHSHYTYSIVIGRFRIMLYRNNNSLNGCA